MPICIAGVHRSGTSMLARLLNLCGLYLGRDEDIIKPRHDNPAGFWENIRFLGINEELLASIGSSWDLPPSAEKVARLASQDLPLKAQAEKLIEEFAGREPWGWKDPRNSLTLPFWKQRILGLKVIIALRNPLEVFQSLNRRGGSSFLFSITLWLIYNQLALAASSDLERIFTHYDSYFHDPRAELLRVADFCGLEVSGDVLADACSAVDTALRHNRVTTDQMRQAGVPAKLMDLYQDLCAEAGPVCKAALSA